MVEDIWYINEVNSKDMSTGSVSQELFQIYSRNLYAEIG